MYFFFKAITFWWQQVEQLKEKKTVQWSEPLASKFAFVAVVETASIGAVSDSKACL